MRTEIMSNKKMNLAYASTATIVAATAMLGTSTVAKAQDVQTLVKNNTKEPKKTKSTNIDYGQKLNDAQKAQAQAKQTVAQITKQQAIAQVADKQAHQNLTDAQNTIEQARVANTAAQTTIKQAETDKAQLKEQITTKQAELTKAKQAGQTLSQNLVSSQTAAYAAQTVASQAKDKIKQAQAAVDQINDHDDPTYADHVSQVQGQITSLQDTLKTNTAKIAASQAQIEQNEQKLKDATTQIQTTQASITKAQLAVAQANDAQNKAQTDLASKSQAAQTAQTTLANYQKQAQQIANDKQSNQTKLEQTQAQLAAKRQELSTLAPQIKALQTKIEVLSNSSKDQTAAIAQAKAKLAAVTTQYNELTKTMQQDQAKVAALKQELKDLQNEPINTLRVSQSYLDAVNEYTNLSVRCGDYENNLFYRHHIPQKEIWQRPEYKKMDQELHSMYVPNGKWHKRMHDVSGESFKLNIYKHNERERHHMVDIRHMTAAEKLELNKFGISLINSVRKQFGRTPLRLNQDGIDFADCVVKYYYADNWGIGDHDEHAINKAAEDFKLDFFKDYKGNSYEDKTVFPFGTTSFADPAGKDFNSVFDRGFAAIAHDNDPEFDRANLRLSMDNLKFLVYSSIRSMICNNNEWNHASDLLNITYRYNPHDIDGNQYSKSFGLAISVLKTDPKEDHIFGDPNIVTVHLLQVDKVSLTDQTTKFGHEHDIEVTDPAQELQKQIKQKRDSLVNAQAVFTESNLAAQQAQTDLAKAQATYDALTNPAINPLAQLEQDRQDLADLQLKQSDAQIAVQTLTDDLQNLTNVKTDLASRQTAIAKQVATAQANFDQTTAALTAAQTTYNKAHTTAQTAAQNLTQLKQTLAKYNQIFTISNQANSNLVATIKTCQKTIANTQTALTVANNELIKSRAALTDYNQAHQADLAKLASAKSELTKAKQVETTAQATLAAKTKAVKQLQAQIAANKQTIAQLELTIKQLQAQITTLDQTINHNKQILLANKNVKDQTAHLAAIAAKADSDLAKITAKLTVAKDKLAQANKAFELAEKEKRAHEWNHEFDTILDPTVNPVDPTVEPVKPTMPTTVEPASNSTVEPTVELTKSVEPVTTSAKTDVADKAVMTTAKNLASDKMLAKITASAPQTHHKAKVVAPTEILPQTGTKQPATLLALVAGSIASILALACSVDRKKKN